MGSIFDAKTPVWIEEKLLQESSESAVVVRHYLDMKHESRIRLKAHLETFLEEFRYNPNANFYQMRHIWQRICTLIDNIHTLLEQEKNQ